MTLMHVVSAMKMAPTDIMCDCWTNNC